MRINQPVTDNEIKLTENTLIVSKTDLKGRITYINQDFLDISGFTTQELIGEPHNIVRHPDMPVEAFDDFWKTLKEGRPWTGYVKNRCKNGDYYWVLANATPIWENGQITGYMSVRRKADAQVIAKIDGIYRQFSAKKQGSQKIRYGQVVTSEAGFFGKLKLGGRMAAILGGLGLVVAVVMAFAMFSLSRTNDNVESLYAERFEPVSIVGRIGKLMADNRSQLLLSLQHDPVSPFAQMHDHPITLHIDTIKKNIAEISTLWDEYLKLIKDDEHRKLADDYAAARKVFVQGGLLAGADLVLKEEFTEATMHIIKQVNPAYAAASGKADVLYKYHTERAQKDVASAEASFQQTLWTLIGAFLALVAIGFIAVTRLIGGVRQPIQSAIDTFRNISQGKYTNVIDISRDDELGKLNQALQTMQTQMGFEVAESKRKAEETARILGALENSTANISISGSDGHLIYITPSGKQLLNSLGGAGFDATSLIGGSVTDLITDPVAVEKMNEGARHGTDVDIEANAHHLRLAARPIIDAAGNNIGRVTQWTDRTPEVTVEREVELIISGAANGDFTQRLDLAGKEGFFRNLSEGLNQLVETTSSGLSAIARVLNALAMGDLTQKIDGDYQGTFGELKDDTNTTVERLREVVGRIKEATEAINTAAKEIAAGNQDLSSRTEEQASSLEETASSMEQLNATVKQNAESARQANELATSSNEIATRGGQMVKQVVDTMSGIQASSQKIADIVGVIDSIAFQTNILALNAAVEAARAGEQGRGFAVVASEVRNLAHRSATAAKEIKLLISESVDKVEGGAQLVHDAGNTMDDVVTSFQQVTRLVMDISGASREQSSGIEQVTQAVSQMDEVTQQNAALVEQAAAAAESLEEQAQGLVQAVGMFKLAAGEGGARPVASKNMPGPALRDATPKQLSQPARPASKKPGKAIPPPHLSDDDEEWAEF